MWISKNILIYYIDNKTLKSNLRIQIILNHYHNDQYYTHVDAKIYGVLIRVLLNGYIWRNKKIWNWKFETLVKHIDTLSFSVGLDHVKKLGIKFT